QALLCLTSFSTAYSRQSMRRSFFFMRSSTTEISTLSLHDALPISHFADPALALVSPAGHCLVRHQPTGGDWPARATRPQLADDRSEEHTSELQSRENLVCRLLLEKKKKYRTQQRNEKKPYRT